MILRAELLVDFDAEDFARAAAHQRVLDALLTDLRSRYLTVVMQIRGRRVGRQAPQLAAEPVACASSIAPPSTLRLRAVVSLAAETVDVFDAARRRDDLEALSAELRALYPSATLRLWEGRGRLVRGTAPASRPMKAYTGRLHRYAQVPDLTALMAPRDDRGAA